MYKQLSELLAAARLISRTSGAKIKELEERLGISRRSVYRLLDTLEGMGFPIYDEYDGKERVIHLNENRKNLRWWQPFPQVQLNLEDRVLLEYLFKEALRTPAIAGELAKLKTKLAPLLAEGGYVIATKESISNNQQPVIFRSPSLSKKYSDLKKTMIHTIIQGIDEQTVCIVSYKAIASDNIRTYRIHPLLLLERNGALYLFVFVPYYGHIRILSVERIKNIELTEEGFERPDDFNPKPWLTDPFGIILDTPFTARIWFSADQAPYIQELTWPENTTIKLQTDGALILTIQTAGAYELKRYVMSFGSQARLLEPEFLRNEIAEEYRKAIKEITSPASP